MISNKMADWLTEAFGKFDYPHETDNYPFRLQDFTDSEIKKAVTDNNIRSWLQLRDFLLQASDDDDVIAHLWGDKSAEARRQSIQQIRKLQETMMPIIPETKDESKRKEWEVEEELCRIMSSI